MRVKRVTMQDIADRAHVSRVTVSKAINNSDRVSPDLKQKILLTAQEMGYGKYDKMSALDKVSAKKTIALAVSRPESSAFWMDIIHSIAKQLSKQKINLLYTYLPSNDSSSFVLPENLYDGSVDGMIVMNVYNPTIYRRLHELKLPKVFLDTPDSFKVAEAEGDILYIAGRAATKKMTQDLIDKGHRRIGFVGDVYYASTNRDRYDGFVDAMNENGQTIDTTICHTSQISVTGYKVEIESFLERLINKGELPGAFVCVSDFVAHFMMDYLKGKGYQIPQDLAMTGFDGNREYMKRGDAFITTAIVDLKAIGDKLVRQILFRMAQPVAPYEVCYIGPEVTFGQSSGSYTK